MLKKDQIFAGKYRVLDLVGQGGMSRVYMVRNIKTNKVWAVKEVRKDGGNSEEVIRQNLIAETNILKALNHPNLPDIIDVYDTDDTYLILMDFIEGKALNKIVKENGAQSQTDVVKWAIQLCDVLGYLHSRDPKIIYRDMKPDNVMLQPDGKVVLIDFGTAREYKEGQAGDTTWLGTTGYAAPEQYGGHGQTDERTDIYNLGATMYHLVTGHNPNTYPYEMSPIREKNPALSAGLEKIITKCTRPNPDERYQSCAELMYALQHYTELEEGFIKKRRREFAAFVTTAVLSVALVTSSLVMKKMASDMRVDHYELYLTEAESAISEEGKIEGYKKAVEVKPGSAKAYIDLLENVYLIDNNFSKEEAEEMTQILGGQTKNGTNEEALQKSNKEYESFAYELGLAYFYYYEGTGNKSASLPWFKTASEGKTLTDAQKTRSELFYRIAGYYEKLGSQNRAGDNTISYKDYWDDLSALTDDDLSVRDNRKTALVGYGEMIYQIRIHAYEFSKAGITREQMEEKIQSILSYIDRDFASPAEDEKDLIDNMKSTAEGMDTVFDTVFGSGEKRTGSTGIADQSSPSAASPAELPETHTQETENRAQDSETTVTPASEETKGEEGENIE